MMKKRIAFACDTPLQILNAINLYESSCRDYRGDIFIYDQFGKAKQIAERLREVNIFENVYLIKRYKEYAGVIQKIATFKRMVFPYLTLKKYLSGKGSIQKIKYDYVVFSFITTFSVTVYGICKKKFIQLEDGIGTYIGDILSDYTSGLFKKIISNTVYNNILNPERVCVYNPKIYSGNTSILQLDSCFSQEVSEKIEFVFEYVKNQIYSENKMIYLSQPFADVKGYNYEKHNAVLKILEGYKQAVLVRMHPREQTDTFSDYNIDLIKNLWELECMHQIENDNVLISCFSTAQLMPKVLKNKEPYVVMIYKLIIDDIDSEYWRAIGSFIEKFKKFYNCPEKIFIPESVSEFEKIMSNILRTGGNYE